MNFPDTSPPVGISSRPASTPPAPNSKPALVAEELRNLLVVWVDVADCLRVARFEHLPQLVGEQLVAKLCKARHAGEANVRAGTREARRDARGNAPGSCGKKRCRAWWS